MNWNLVQFSLIEGAPTKFDLNITTKKVIVLLVVKKSFDLMIAWRIFNTWGSNCNSGMFHFVGVQKLLIKFHAFERYNPKRIPHCAKYVQIRIFFWSEFSPNTGKYGPQKTPYLDTFYAVPDTLSYNNIKIEFSNVILIWDKSFQKH